MKKNEIIAHHMEKLGLTAEEALALYEEDKMVEKMKDSDVDNDLTPEQREAKRAMCSEGNACKERSPNMLGFEFIKTLLERYNIDYEVSKEDKEFIADLKNKKFRIAVTPYKPRTKKS